MRLHQRNNQGREGVALLMAMGIAVVLSLMLVGYLALTANESTLSARSLAWNNCIPTAEAGVEEALTLLALTPTNRLATNGWALGGDGRYNKSQTLASGTLYGTGIQLVANPIIWSTGYVSAPFGGTNVYLRRLLKVTARKAPNFGGGLTAVGTILMSGGAYMDSFDSTDPAHSTNGLYSKAVATSNMVASTNLKTVNAIKMTGGAYINGTAATGPGGTVSPATSVYGTVRNDANVQINDNVAPVFSTYSIVLPANVTVNGTNYPYGVTTGNYMLADLNIGGNPMVVNGNAVIYCTSTGNNVVNISGSGFIYITPGSSLVIYTAGNMVVSGGGVMNGTQHAINCVIYGLPTCTQVTYSGSADFVGVINAPEADFTFSGGESASGAFTVNTANVSGSGGVHADTSLNGTGKIFTVLSWDEVPVQ